MNNKATCSVIGLLVLAANASDCPREASRRVRTFLQKNVYPKLLPLEATELPLICQLHPMLDLYREQELNKKEVTRGDWKCLYCGKHFRSEFYLDRHMHNRHTEKLVEASAATCLGDLCPIFGCDDKKKKNSVNNSQPKNRKKKDFNLDRCTAEDVERSRYRCEVISRRCFVDPKLQRQFFDSVCQKLHCEGSVLRGIITDGTDDEKKGSLVFSLLRWVAAALLFGFAAVYALLSGLCVWPRRSDPSRAPKSEGLTKLFSQITAGSAARLKKKS